MTKETMFLGCVVWVMSAVVAVALKQPMVMIAPVVATFFLFLASVRN